MSFTLGNPIAVSTNFIKSNPAVPVYKGEELFGVIYHIEIGYNENNKEKIKQYIIIDFKEYNLSSESKEELINIAKSYCESKNISDSDELEIALLDNEEVEKKKEKRTRVLFSVLTLFYDNVPVIVRSMACVIDHHFVQVYVTISNVNIVYDNLHILIFR